MELTGDCIMMHVKKCFFIILVIGVFFMTTSAASAQQTGTPGEPAESFANFLGMTFNLIPAGTFMMGSPSDELGRRDDETLHQVILTQPFFMQTTPVTQGQWKAVMGNNPSYFSDCGDDCPVEYVSWHDVQDFISRLNTLGQGTYRLPTEAEWEYAARAGSTTAFANGDITRKEDDPNLDVMGWYRFNSDRRTHPVARKQPNAWGLYDMHGNVWEWVQDRYGKYPSGSVTDPEGPNEGPEQGSQRVLRGGSLFVDAWVCRSAFRHHYVDLLPGSNLEVHGFRLLKAY